jgi:4'-phosphopantetheinyl transferase
VGAGLYQHAARQGIVPMALDAPTAKAASETTLPPGPRALPSPAPGIDLWVCGLLASPDALASLAAMLAPAESARAARFGTEALRNRYIAGRGTLRQLLGKRLDLPPERVDIRRGSRGRPYVDGAAGLDFNVSHTGAFALIGMTSVGRIGVDVEHEGRALNAAGVARKFMATSEQAMLDALDSDLRRRTLLRLWTCKEAMSKATGEALSAPFRRIAIALDESGARVDAGPHPYLPRDWTLHALRAPGDHLATIALWTGG